MPSIVSSHESSVWTVVQAKARLSELLRMSNEAPQYIGARSSYVVIPQAKWRALNSPAQPLGQWLVDNMAGLEEKLDGLALPDRTDPEREIPFH